MAAPAFALQVAVVAALKASSAVTALVANRVFDRVAADAGFPYVTIGSTTTTLDRGQDYEGEGITMAVHAWSRAVGFPEVRALAWAIKQALEHADLTLQGYRLVDLELVNETVFRDPDGITSHAALTFRADVEPT